MECPFCGSTSFNTVDLMFNIGVKCNSCFMVVTNERARNFNDFFKKFNSRKTQWISVENRLPISEEDEESYPWCSILTNNEDGEVFSFMGFYNTKDEKWEFWNDSDAIGMEVTHWMYIDKLQEEK